MLATQAPEHQWPSSLLQLLLCQSNRFALRLLLFTVHTFSDEVDPLDVLKSLRRHSKHFVKRLAEQAQQRGGSKAKQQSRQPSRAVDMFVFKVRKPTGGGVGRACLHMLQTYPLNSLVNCVFVRGAGKFCKTLLLLAASCACMQLLMENSRAQPPVLKRVAMHLPEGRQLVRMGDSCSVRGGKGRNGKGGLRCAFWEFQGEEGRAVGRCGIVWETGRAVFESCWAGVL